MGDPLPGLDIASPVLAAPMAGGATTPELVIAVARAGSFGFLAGGYKKPEQLALDIQAVRQHTPAFGVNLFAPGRQAPIEQDVFRAYADAIADDARNYDIDLSTARPVEDDDGWAGKIDVVIAERVPVVSFTFAVPDPAVVERLKDAGILPVQTITNHDEAELARTAGITAMILQGSGAGGHSAVTTPEVPVKDVPLTDLVADMRSRSDAPIIAAGGISTSEEAAAVLAAGADAVMVGTVLLRSRESGASAVHKAAIADASRGPTVVTRAFTGRPARALPNEFIRKYDAIAPFGYPAIHYLTSGLRKAAAAAGNPEMVHLWAGTGYQKATDEPAGLILKRLAGQ
ncbi:MAG TPA: nitronate monooxygenase [Trebonia sp.]